MRIAIGADHAGFALKESLRHELEREGHHVIDMGTTSPESVDYPDYASAVAHAVSAGQVDKGFLVCHTGMGMMMAANKIPGIRAALAANADAVQLTREHNDANILAMGAKYTTPEQAAEYGRIFLETPYQAGRHVRRLEKIAALEAAEAIKKD
jgi:ribose 5-phosphate isomerase B